MMNVMEVVERQVAEARLRARESHPGRVRTRGPFAEMLLEAGFTVAEVRERMVGVFGEDEVDRVMAEAVAGVTA